MIATLSLNAEKLENDNYLYSAYEYFPSLPVSYFRAALVVFAVLQAVFAVFFSILAAIHALFAVFPRFPRSKDRGGPFKLIIILN